MNLICVEDGIDSSKEAGKLLISIIATAAEMERENICAVILKICKELRLRLSLLDCGNTSVMTEAASIKFNAPKLFLEEDA